MCGVLRCVTVLTAALRYRGLSTDSQQRGRWNTRSTRHADETNKCCENDDSLDAGGGIVVRPGGDEMELSRVDER